MPSPVAGQARQQSPVLTGKAFDSILQSNSTMRVGRDDEDLLGGASDSSTGNNEVLDERLHPSSTDSSRGASPDQALRQESTYREESSTITASNPDSVLRRQESWIGRERTGEFAADNFIQDPPVLPSPDSSISPESFPRPRQTTTESPTYSRNQLVNGLPTPPGKSNGRSVFPIASTSNLQKSSQQSNGVSRYDSQSSVLDISTPGSPGTNQLELSPSAQSSLKNAVESTPRSSFSNTMRKTSRFFRKLGSSSKQSKDTATSSNGTAFSPPPVPSLPSSYAYDRNAPTRYDASTTLTNTATSNEPQKLSLEPSSPFFGIIALPNQANLVPAPATRRRSSSQATAITVRDSRSSKSSKGSEDDRLRRELSSWKLDLDGTIGNIGKRESGYSQSTTVPTTSTEKSPSVGPESPTVSIATLKERPLSPPTSTVIGEVPEAPSIRLVSPSYIIQRSEGNIAPTESERSLPIPLDGLGFELETITESGHSRENSSQPADLNSLSLPSAPPINRFNSSPSLSNSTSSLSTGSPLLQTRKNLARQSVVAYHPVMRARSVSPGMSDGMRNGFSKSREPSENGGIDSPGSISTEERAMEFANRCWEEDETFLEARKIAEWLGSTGRLNAAALCLYIDKFDFSGLRLDMAFRKLCDKLYLKAETQQVDRILEQFSRRYWDNNPSSVFGSADVVHAVSYSLLLLNTDLHVVETSTRMLRSQFVKNTLSAIHSQKSITSTPTTPALLFGVERGNDSTNSIFNVSEAGASMRSLDRFRERSSNSTPSNRNALTGTNLTTPPSLTRPISPLNDNGSPTRSVRSPASPQASLRGTSVEMEYMLKEMYGAIKAQPIFQPMNGSLTTLDGRSSISLAGSSSYNSWNGMNRSASRRSATSTVSTSSAFKRSSIRGFNSFLGTSSLELPRSASPTPSTATSLSEDMFSTAYGAAASTLHNSGIGFAKTLSHSIREQQEDDLIGDDEVAATEEELALSGAPWAKEGIIFRKHYWESTGRRSKDKNWLQVFVVISKGDLRMFRFDGAGTIRSGGAALGGGDWTSNAQNVGSISLIHALCSPLAPPGYNRDRPHCYVLTLPEGGSYFFQAGTQDLVTEWVSTCNYWSARLSKLPLSGGVSNMEYGWNKVIDLENEVEEMGSIRSGKSGKSGISSRSKVSYQGSFAGAVAGTERIFVNDWAPPNVPVGASTLSEEVQLENLIRHVKITKAELAHHNTLRSGILKLYSPRTINSAKAIANWEKKSSHLLSENVKYQTYAEALASAIKLREVKKGEKEILAMLKASDEVFADETGISSTPNLESSSPSFDNFSPPRTRFVPHYSRESVAMSVAMSTVSTQQSNDEFFDSVELTSSKSNSISE